MRGRPNRLELATLNNCAQLDMNPNGRIGSDKWARLFTEENGTRVAPEAKDVLAQIVLERLT